MTTNIESNAEAKVRQDIRRLLNLVGVKPDQQSANGVPIEDEVLDLAQAFADAPIDQEDAVFERGAERLVPLLLDQLDSASQETEHFLDPTVSPHTVNETKPRIKYNPRPVSTKLPGSMQHRFRTGFRANIKGHKAKGATMHSGRRIRVKLRTPATTSSHTNAKTGGFNKHLNHGKVLGASGRKREGKRQSDTDRDNQ